MQGFILSTKLNKEEDKIVKILTSNEIITLYRFYGARHSQLQRGNLIDFVIENNIFGKIPKLRSPIQIPFLPLSLSIDEKLKWDIFFKFLNYHLRGVLKLPPFYYQKLFFMSKELNFRPTTRVLIEGLFEILKFEGSLAFVNKCNICHFPLQKKVAVERNSFHLVHPSCAPSAPSFPKRALQELYIYQKSVLFTSSQLEILWKYLF
jgi:recombinational DNA repair protein (RecF pathway)